MLFWDNFVVGFSKLALHCLSLLLPFPSCSGRASPACRELAGLLLSAGQLMGFVGSVCMKYERGGQDLAEGCVNH